MKRNILIALKPTRLASVAEVIFSSVDKLSQAAEIPVRLCNYTDVYYNRRIDNRLNFKRATATQREIDRFRLRAGDVVITKDSEGPDDIAVPAYVVADIADLVCGYHLAILRPKNGTLDGRFLLQLLQLNHTRHYFATLASGVTRFGLGTDAIKEASILLPSFSIQQKIADILGSWDDALEKLDALIATKTRRKSGLMQQLLIGKRRLPIFKSTKWKAVRMHEVLERVFRPFEPESDKLLPLVSIRRRCGGLFRRPDILASAYKTQDLHRLKTGDFLISKRQVVHGAWAIVEREFDATLVSKEYAIFVNRASGKLDMRFFSWLAQTPRMLRLARISSTGVHIEKLIFDPEVFLREQIRIPADTKEQAAIAAVLDAADTELRLLRQQREALDQQKRGLMQQLLTGRRRVKIAKE